MRCELCNAPSRGPLCAKHIRGWSVLKNGWIIKNRPGRMSKPAKQILRVLLAGNYQVLFEVSFPWCREQPGRVRLPFDFVLPKEKIIIEYDGQQHFKQVKFFHRTRASFLAYLRRDHAKERLAKQHGYKVIRFDFREKLDEKMIILRITEAIKNGR